MTYTGQDFVFQGTVFSQTFILSDQSTGLPIDVTGWTFKSELRGNVNDANAALTLDSGSGGFTILDAPNGKISMNMTPTQTATLSAAGGSKKYAYDVLRTDSGLGPFLLFGGKITVKTPVTR